MRRLFVGLLLGLAAVHPAEAELPYARAGLTPQEAAAHLLNRFTFGPRPGEVDQVVHQGLEAWFSEQLQPDRPDPTLESRLHMMGALSLPDSEVVQSYVDSGRMVGWARREHALDSKPPATPEGQRDYNRKLLEFIRSKGYKLSNELMDDLYAQKLLRAVYSRNQMREVMTDFWFNHFNVSRTNTQARLHLLSYERDSIRPNVFGHFRALLGATAKHPAMLYYLNNADSVALRAPERLPVKTRGLVSRSQRASKRGVNENFARELMELHTLGVDGGYNQRDVEQVARAITGWTSFGDGAGVERFIAVTSRRPGVIREGNFFFQPALHDNGPKLILGQVFPAGHGLDEGERVLDLLANQEATARFLARKLAVRFVSDHPNARLVQRLTDRYLKTHGDLTKVYLAVVESPEFWAEARRAKVKTAFEYVVSSIRALQGELVDPKYSRTLSSWLERMGQPMYGYQAPTGFPDRAEIWVSSGSLVNRINFAFALVSQRLEGVRIDTDPLQETVENLSVRLMPGRDVSETVKLVKATLNDPSFFQRIRAKNRDFSEGQKVGGILISSPEFQRR